MTNGVVYKTLVERIDSAQPVVYPTSTLPALGCRYDKESLDNLFSLKKRPSNMPVSLAVLDLNQAAEIVEVSESAVEIINNFPQGSITLVLPALEKMDERLGGEMVAVRPISNEKARGLLSLTGPLTATSANISGSLPTLDCTQAALDLGLTADAALPECTSGGPPSTLISLNPEATIIREGVISAHQVYQWSRMKS